MEYSLDTAYNTKQVIDHETTATIFQNEINNGRDQDVKIMGLED
jgi:hypothetical protein